MTVRANPRMRMVNSVLRTYITVLHVAHEQKEVIFSGTGKIRAADTVPGTPGTPQSPAGSEVGSQVRTNTLIDAQTSFFAREDGLSDSCALPWTMLV